ncbi:MAG: SHOCT domain-containing protein, partial [Clostridiales Family XIII bacterium]|nr:SHOCT domain-containing protein [Clostridiales Family XIII bacterium]
MDLIDTIERLAKLKEEGHLTEDEYQKQKARLLNTRSEASPNEIGMAYGQPPQAGQYAQPPRTSQYAQMPNGQVQKVYPWGFFFLGLVVCIPLNMLSRMVDSG